MVKLPLNDNAVLQTGALPLDVRTALLPPIAKNVVASAADWYGNPPAAPPNKLAAKPTCCELVFAANTDAAMLANPTYCVEVLDGNNDPATLANPTCCVPVLAANKLPAVSANPTFCVAVFPLFNALAVAALPT